MDNQDRVRLEDEYREYGLRYYTPKEEFWNAVTHGIGAPIALGFLIYLLVIADGIKEVMTALLLCVPAMQVFVTSCVYHALTNKPKKSVARRIDHANISFLVTACGVPPALIFGSSVLNYVGIGVCFALAILGAVLCIKDLMKFKSLNVGFNAVIGLICFLIYVLNIKSPYATFEINIIYLTGFLCCIIGLILYCIKKIPYVHTVFHVFTLVGPILFFVGTVMLFGLQ